MTPTSAFEPVDTGDSLSVAAVAALVGVAPSTLRTWARRYGLEPSGHRSGLHRRYSDIDVSRLQLMRTLTQSGLSSRDAADRARCATADQLALAAVSRPFPEGAVRPDPRHEAVLPERRPLAPLDRGAVEGLDPAVRTLLATIGRGDARGATALLRIAIRDLGAARAYDERVRPVRRALWLLAPDVRRRCEELASVVVHSAVGEITLRREPRNGAAVLVSALPGDEDEAALLLARAALGERSIDAGRLSLGHTEADAVRRLERVPAGSVVALHVADGLVPAQVAARVRGLAPATVVLWGDGWVHWPGQEATLADVVRAVEGVSTADA